MKDKTCIITGATAGIGLETAARLGALGARLLLVGRSREKGNAVLAQLRSRVSQPKCTMRIFLGLMRSFG